MRKRDNTDAIQNKKLLLDRYMASGDYELADKIVEQIVHITGISSLEHIDPVDLKCNPSMQELVRELVQIKAAIVIETMDYAIIDKVVRILQYDRGNPYSVFLWARLLWLQKKFFAAFQLLIDKFGIEFLHDSLSIDQNSIYWQAQDEVKERILNLVAQGYKHYGMPEAACLCYMEASSLTQQLSLKIMEYSNYLFNAHYVNMSPKSYYQAHLGFNSLFKDIEHFVHNHDVHCCHKKIRLGYISSDFRHHVVLNFCWTMLTCFDRERFEVYCFSTTRKEDGYSASLKKQVNRWYNIADLGYGERARLIYGLEIDILVELAGHTQGNNLPVLAYKPAPIQICGIGYFATTGLDAVDYFITDKYLLHADSHQYFVEELLPLPQSHFSYTSQRDVPEVQGAPCIKNGYITFGSFNNLTN